jgi:hypothetical protein
MCPEYEQCADSSLYEAAYDVYSVGVVMMELISGCSINSRTSRGQTEDFDESRRCVEERQENRFPNTLEELKKQADACIQWNPKSLDLICKAALLCVTPTNLGRMTMNDLVSQLNDAVDLNSRIEFLRTRTHACAATRCVFCYCEIATMKCDEGHAVCPFCIEVKILDRQSCQQVCPIDNCSSDHEYLSGYISPDILKDYVQNRFENATDTKHI